MDILSLTNCPLDPRLGSGKTVLAYTEGLRSEGHSVDVFQPSDFELWHGHRRLTKFRQALGSWAVLQERLRKRHYDLIEFYGDEFWLAVRYLAKMPQRPLLVAHTNGLELLDWDRSRYYRAPRGRVYESLMKPTHIRTSYAMFRNTDAFVALCELDRQYVVDRRLYPRERTAVVEPGLDPEYLCRPFSPSRAQRVAFAGSWIERKDTATLAAVMNKVMSSNTSVQFDIFGTAAEPSAILHQFSAAVRPRITVHPKLPTAELARRLSEARVFLFPSQYEGFGIAVAEAMACACAVVTTPTGFAAGLQSGTEVLLCSFGNVDSMERAVSNLLKEDDLHLHVARGGWERVRSLTWERNTKILNTLYSGWVEEHQASWRKSAA